MKGRPEERGGDREEDRARSRRIETEKEKRKVPRMSARRKRRREARSEGREEWFTCIASIALAQGQRVCETEDQTGSGPPSFQFPAPCSLTAPRRSLASRSVPTSPRPLPFSLLRSFLRIVPLPVRKQLHHERAATFEGLLRACGRLRIPGTKYKE